MNEIVNLEKQEKEVFQARYRASKDVIQNLQTEKKNLEAKLEEMKKELIQIRMELRNSKVQGIVADSKIRSEFILFLSCIRKYIFFA
jgi:hypothetical protein